MKGISRACLQPATVVQGGWKLKCVRNGKGEIRRKVKDGEISREVERGQWRVWIEGQAKNGAIQCTVNHTERQGEIKFKTRHIECEAKQQIKYGEIKRTEQ